MPQHLSKVSDEYAARTPCSKHSMVYSGVARGSMRHGTYSQCEFTSMNFHCRYSHTAFNTKRVVKLAMSGGSALNIVKFEYGYGFERYGAYESPDSGWDVKLNERDIGDRNSRRHDLPKSLLLAEISAGIATKNGPQYEKKQSICVDHNSTTDCARGNGCKYDHDIIDSARIEALGNKYSGATGLGVTCDYLIVECHVSNDSITWKITIQPDALVKGGNLFGGLRPTAEVTYSGDDLLGIIKRFEDTLGISK